jgi:hypothetical protein
MGVWIAYDLIGTDEKSEDYEKLIAKIKTLGTVKKVEYSLWVSDTTLTPEQVRDALKPFLDTNDKLIVMKRVGGSAWTNLGGAGQWLLDHPP